MTLPKICAIVSVCALAAIIVPGAGLQYAAGKGWIRQTPSLETGYKIYVLAMFCVMSFSAIGAMVGLFVHLQLKIGNQDHAMIRMLRDHQTGFILGFWGFLFLGLAVAAPAILHDMLGIRPGIGISQGVLRADIGMTIDEVAKASTLKIAAAGAGAILWAHRGASARLSLTMRFPAAARVSKAAGITGWKQGTRGRAILPRSMLAFRRARCPGRNLMRLKSACNACLPAMDGTRCIMYGARKRTFAWPAGRPVPAMGGCYWATRRVHAAHPGNQTCG